MTRRGADEDDGLSRWLLRLVGGLLIATALAVSLSRAPERPVESLVARWAPPPSQFVELGEQLVHLRDEGDAQDPLPLLLLHDVGSSLHTWQAWAPRLARQRRVISLDLPGAGLTGPQPQADYRPTTSARLVLAVMDQLQLPRVQLVGNGLGGEVALQVASLAPARVERLLLLNPTGLPWQPLQPPPAFLVARLPVLHWLSESLLPHALMQAQQQFLRAPATPPSAAEVDRSFELLLREGNRRALHQQLLQWPDASTAATWQPPAVPVRIVWGQQDRWLPADLADRLKARIPHADLVRLPEAGHLPQEDDTPGAWAAARTFLGL